MAGRGPNTNMHINHEQAVVMLGAVNVHKRLLEIAPILEDEHDQVALVGKLAGCALMLQAAIERIADLEARNAEARGARVASYRNLPW